MSEKSKLIPFSTELEKAIEADAKRCERSFVRQVVAVLKTYYEVESVEVNQQRLEFVGELLPRSKKGIRVLENEPKQAKKKAG